MKEYSKKVIGRLIKDIREFGLAGVLLVVCMAAFVRLSGAFCPIVLFTGFPCPGCGITRAAVLLLTGRWPQAWRMNPVIFPIIIAILYFGINRYFLGRKARGMKWIVVGIAVLLVIVYILRMGQYFPGREPYSYHSGNVLEKVVPGYPIHRPEAPQGSISPLFVTGSPISEEST